MLMDYWGRTDVGVVMPNTKAEGSPRTGYTLGELGDTARTAGLKAFEVSMRDKPQGELTDQLQKGRPLICAVRIPQQLYAADRTAGLAKPAYRRASWLVGKRKDHFLVVFGSNQRKVLVVDPTHGVATMRWKAFLKAWGCLRYAALVCSS
jgi:hypothetical protein